MKRLALALSILLGLANAASAENIVGPPNAIFCNKNANSAILSAGTTQLIAGATNQIINTCGYVFSGAAAGTLQLVFGTGSSCTTPTTLTALFTTASSVNLQDHFSYAWASSTPGQSLCAVVTGTSSVSVAVYYSQF